MPDESLDSGGELARIRHDPDALDRFYRQHVEPIQRFVARRVNDPHLVADLTAEVFMAAILSAHTYRPADGDPTRWLYGVARNVVSAALRREGREHRALGRVAGRRLLGPDDVDRMLDRLDADAAGRELYAAMDDLPSGERAVLELVALDGLTVAGAARALHITCSPPRSACTAPGDGYGPGWPAPAKSARRSGPTATTTHPPCPRRR